eukprot:gene1606-3098_t
MDNIGIATENFVEIVENVEVIGMIIYMDKSCHIWLSLSGCPKSMGSLITSMPTKYDAMPISTSLLEGSISDDTFANGLARRISKRFDMQCFISNNIPETFEEGLIRIEQRVISTIDAHLKVLVEK